jgi:hypothetical protein
MRRLLIAAIALFSVTAMVVSALAEITPTLVEGGAGDQIRGSANSGWVMWSSNTTQRPDHYDTLARPTSGAPFRVNASGTEGLSGGLSGNTSQAIYQQTDGTSSDLFLYDLSTKTRRNPPTGINTNLWEWSPSISPGYTLFGRNSFRSRSSPWKVILYKRATGVSKLLMSVENRCECIFPGQVTDQYATWTKCSLTVCQSWYYTIATGVAARIPNPLSQQTYYPAVAPTSGNIYFGRSNSGCGVSTKIYRWNPATPGTTVLVSSLADGHDLSTSSLANRSGGHDDVYIAELLCSGRFNANIYEIGDADTATMPPSQERDSRTSGVDKHLVPLGATPR